MRTVKEVLHL